MGELRQRTPTTSRTQVPPFTTGARAVTRFALAAIALVGPVAAATTLNAQTQPSLEEIFYGAFKPVESFGHITLRFEGDDAKAIGMSEEDLTNLLKLRFKNNFAKIPYRDPGPKANELYVKPEGAKVGLLWCQVWLVGTDYPIAYHVECKAGTFKDVQVWHNAVLGYGSKQTVPDRVRAALGKIVEALAVSFFKARGEL